MRSKSRPFITLVLCVASGGQNLAQTVWEVDTTCVTQVAVCIVHVVPLRAAAQPHVTNGLGNRGSNTCQPCNAKLCPEVLIRCHTG